VLTLGCPLLTILDMLEGMNDLLPRLFTIIETCGHCNVTLAVGGSFALAVRRPTEAQNAPRHLGAQPLNALVFTSLLRIENENPAG